MSEMIRSYDRRRTFSRASSVEVLRPISIPRASRACLSNRLLSGRSSTHRIRAPCSRRCVRGLGSAAATSRGSATAPCAASPGARVAIAAPRAAAASCWRFAIASTPGALKLNSPRLLRKSAREPRNRTRKNSKTVGQIRTPTSWAMALTRLLAESVLTLHLRGYDDIPSSSQDDRILTRSFGYGPSAGSGPTDARIPWHGSDIACAACITAPHGSGLTIWMQN